ncbi:hypothetical protein DM860_010832 [Cuscuta australis]|uniref:DUF7804 domain-containing protein n=1 Tax=Cuscuta australis TaxID=267555 RepID=A0A328E1G0_9ASTE|nr:hypothetical protein DM860_010832 [Cuscuta australis]
MACMNLHPGIATNSHPLFRGNQATIRPRLDPVRMSPVSKKNRIQQQRVYASCSPPCDCRVDSPDRFGQVAVQGEAGEEGNKIAAEKLDRWMRGSVAEIVKNLNRAPLLVHLYSEEDGRGGEKAEMRTERAVVEEWPAVKGEWERGERPSPDGLIFVEEVRPGEEVEVDEEEEEEEERCNGGNAGEWGGANRAWGVVVQGRGAECGPACYLLKTSSVGSGMGMGSFSCTHFCLVRVKSFRESAFLQFKNCWLLQ